MTQVLRRRGRLLASGLVAIGLVAGVVVSAGAPAATAAPPSAAAAPSTIPALQTWTPASGEVLLSSHTRIAVDPRDRGAEATAQTLAGDLEASRGWHTPLVPAGSARPGDIVLRSDAARHDLGDEGYALQARGEVAITAPTPAGLFYGTRTVLQLLAAGTRIPAGSTVDIPKYRERGVAVCACYTYYTDAWLERLIRDMAYLKLNYLHLEIKVKSSTDPSINSFSYYTPAEISRLVALATRYHITVVPEINSPGHIDPYLEGHPELQLVDKSGVADPTRLDITKPAAFSFYTGLIDAYRKVFPGPFWHMGADEYMLGSAYANYPQLLAYARAKYGPNATAQDAYIDFINRVDGYVRAHGQTLRIWNDGLTGDNTVPLNKDVVVEHWLGEKITPQMLLDEGHPVMNASAALYYIRGGSHLDPAKLYDTGWSPLDFVDQTVAAGQAGLTGAELAVWPDNYGAETENTAQQGLVLPLRVLAQATWGSPDPAGGYAAFTTLAQTLGHGPGWGPAWSQPLRHGVYRIRNAATGGRLGAEAGSTASGTDLVADPAGSTTWELTPTDDGYYQVKSSTDGLCAEVKHGTPNRLGVIEQPGATLSQETCSTANTQKWQLEPDRDGYRIVNATTQQAADASGPGRTVVQEPRDVAGRATWQIAAG